MLADGWVGLTISVTLLLVDLVASGHAVLRRRDARAAVAWVGFIWLVPGLGAVLYALLGVNRIRRRAVALHREQLATSRGELPSAVDGVSAALSPLVTLGDRVVARQLLAGNAVTPLVDGTVAYREMLAAVDAARSTITLSTYIFDNDAVGRRFAVALGRAVARGVEVRVLVDAVGLRYTFPTIFGTLRRAGVRVARFLPTIVPTRALHFNLRNHRKILVVDGTRGFTGGMNLRVGHDLEARPAHPVRDVHFRLEGPVVGHLRDVFAEDWLFATRERLVGERWNPPLAPAGTILARGVSDGPDHDFETLRTLMIGALSCARASVRIVTPYFLPDQGLITALNVAALRGVAVEILIPARGNLKLVQWACTAQLWQLLAQGCRVYLAPPPFDHTKLFVIDREWSLIGSTNWDPRSLRLNFELNVECYSAGLADALDRLVSERIAAARELRREDLARRSLAVQLRDGLARLLSPYL